MQYLAYISLGFVALQFLNVLLNMFFSQRIKRTTASNSKTISILIPARNEEENIGFLLNDLSKIESENIEIIVCDDQSTDNTYNIVNQYIESNNKIKIIQSKKLPKGWLGKNYACYQLSQAATGNYLLFVDADVRLQGNIVQDTVAYLEKHQLGLLSIFPVQIQKTFGEKISVPIMNYILLTLLPLIFVRISPFSSHSAANGQFMLFDANTYKKNQPHKMFKNSAVEDITISRHFKKKNIKIACLTGEKKVQCRMYKNYKAALNGFAKNIFMFFGNSRLLAFLFWIIVALGSIPVLLFKINFFIIYLVLYLMVLLLYSFVSKQNMILNVLLFPIQILFLLQVMLTNIFNKKQYLWKGRNIYS